MIFGPLPGRIRKHFADQSNADIDQDFLDSSLLRSPNSTIGPRDARLRHCFPEFYRRQHPAYIQSTGHMDIAKDDIRS